MLLFLAPASTKLRRLLLSCNLVGLMMTSSFTRPTLTAPTGPFHGMSDRARAVEAEGISRNIVWGRITHLWPFSRCLNFLPVFIFVSLSSDTFSYCCWSFYLWLPIQNIMQYNKKNILIKHINYHYDSLCAVKRRSTIVQSKQMCFHPGSKLFWHLSIKSNCLTN